MGENKFPGPVCILWFRHGLRLHDNPAFHAAISKENTYFLPVFIFDGESAGTKLVGFNRMRYLIESLEDLNKSFETKYGGNLKIFRGDPVEIFEKIHKTYTIDRICYEQDCEPIWKTRDDNVTHFCQENGIESLEFVSHTLYDPKEIIEANGGSPPLTYASFMFVISTLGKPPRPVLAPAPTLIEEAESGNANDKENQITFFPNSDELPFEMHQPLTPEHFGISKGKSVEVNARRGGETFALELHRKRMELERIAFEKGLMLPNHSNPDLIQGVSLSPALRYGCLSVRHFYWSVHDLFSSVVDGKTQSFETITGQLIWREYFYVMSVLNPVYDKMGPNPICLNIPWATDASAKEKLKKWKEGRTGFPFIDAAMKQLVEEGWLHHVTRNAVACFLTRGDLWISWENGLKHFLKYLLDADWSVCAGNWMWVSSSAFENVLDCTHCICPTNYAQRLDPEGLFIKRYIPALKNFTAPYIFEPWNTPLKLQTEWGCIIGKDYPKPIVNHEAVSKRNCEEMTALRTKLTGVPDHPCPSNTAEARNFMWFPDCCSHEDSNPRNQ